MLSPRWLSQPTSGAGAARFGGGWNAQGRPALYLSANHETAIAEYMQGLVHPGTLAPFDVTAGRILDVSNQEALDAIGAVHLPISNWRYVRDVERGVPDMWAFADAAVTAGFCGMLVRSSQTQASNLVLWRWNEGEGADVRVIDPAGDLPRNASSWRK